MKKQFLTLLALVSTLTTTVVLAQQKMDDMKGMNTGLKPAASAQATHAAKGTVKKIDSKTGSVLMAHEPVNSLNWPAMTMSFKVKNKALLAELKEGQKVDFEFVQEGGDYVVKSLK